MLHILLLILKIISIILAAILGIIILLLCIILLVPIRYEMTSRCEGNIESLKVKGSAYWILRLFGAEVYVKGRKVKWQLKLAWKKKTNALEFGGHKDEEKDSALEKENQDKEVYCDDTKNDKDTEKVEKISGNNENVQKDVTPNQEGADKEKNVDESAADKTDSKKGIKTKVDELILKINKIYEFLTNRFHVRALEKIKKEIYVLLKKLKPQKFNVKLKFGFEDPGMTGKVLGGLSMLYPLFEGDMEIMPDFEKKVLKESLYIKGRIRIWHLAVFAIKLLLCKDVRISYKDIRNFNLEEV